MGEGRGGGRGREKDWGCKISSDGRPNAFITST